MAVSNSIENVNASLEFACIMSENMNRGNIRIRKVVFVLCEVTDKHLTDQELQDLNHQPLECTDASATIVP